MKRGIFLGIMFAIFANVAFAQSTTTNLGITKPQTGQAQPQVTISTGFDNFDAAIAGRLSKSVAGSSDVTLTTVEARNQILEFTGAITASINVIVPSKNRTYLVYNNTSGSFTLTVKTSGGSGIAVTQGQRAWLYCDTTNVVSVTATGSGAATTLTITIANAGTTGTLADGLTKLTGAPSTAVRTATSDTGGAVGVVTAGAGTSGSATIQIAGQVNCVFENATTAGNYVGLGTTTAGNCRDVGSTYPTSGQVVGRVLSTNGSAGTYAIVLFPAEMRGAAAGGTLTVKEVDGTPTVANVTTLRVSNGTLTDDTGGQVTITNSGGGSAAWNALTDPAGDLSLAMAANLTTFTWAGNYSTSSAFKLAGNNTSATGPLAEFSSAVSNIMPVLLLKPRGGQSFKADHLGSLLFGKDNPGATDTDGYTYFGVIGSNLGPSGTPTSNTGFAPIVIESDGINDERTIHLYAGSKWNDIGGVVKRWDTGSGTSAQTIDFNSSTSAVVSRQFTLTGNVTFTFSNAPKAGTLISLKIIQDGTGGRTVTWPASVKWPGGTPFSPTSTANAKDVYLFLWDGSNYWFISQSQDLQ